MTHGGGQGIISYELHTIAQSFSSHHSPPTHVIVCYYTSCGGVWGEARQPQGRASLCDHLALLPFFLINLLTGFSFFFFSLFLFSSTPFLLAFFALLLGLFLRFGVGVDDVHHQGYAA